MDLLLTWSILLRCANTDSLSTNMITLITTTIWKTSLLVVHALLLLIVVVLWQVFDLTCWSDVCIGRGEYGRLRWATFLAFASVALDDSLIKATGVVLIWGVLAEVRRVRVLLLNKMMVLAGREGSMVVLVFRWADALDTDICHLRYRVNLDSLLRLLIRLVLDNDLLTRRTLACMLGHDEIRLGLLMTKLGSGLLLQLYRRNITVWICRALLAVRILEEFRLNDFFSSRSCLSGGPGMHLFYWVATVTILVMAQV